MKFDSKTIQVLKNFSTINPSMYFRKGLEQSTIAPIKTIFAKANLDQEFEKDFAIYDMAKFLGVLSLFNKESPELIFEDTHVIVSHGSERIKYTYASPDSIVYPSSDKKIKIPRPDIQFTMPAEMLSSVMKASQVLASPEIGVLGKDGKISMTSFDSRNPTGDVYLFEIGETDKNFNVIFKVEYMKILPQTYNVTISSDGIAYFKGDFIEYWVAVDEASKFGG